MKIQVKIIKETKKAKLVEDNKGNQGWVQNRSFKNGEVNLSVFEKSVSFLNVRAEEKVETDNFNQGETEIEISWENEKAIAFDKEAEFVQCSSMWHIKSIRIFLPKSICRNENGKWFAPNWSLIKNLKEKLPTYYEWRV